MYKISPNLRNLFGKVRVDLIPSVSEFQTFISSYSEFAAIFGLKSPNRKETLKQFTELRKANKYITRMNYRLMVLAQQGRMAEHDYLSKIIISRSDAFLVAGIHLKYDHWYQKSWSKVISIIHKVRRIATGDVDLNFKRVWIDKKPGDYARPVDAPAMEWRIHSSLLNRIMENCLRAKDGFSTWQHAGRSFKGTHTAWQQVMFILRDSPYIYEFDIKGFFNNIITANAAPFLGPSLQALIQKIVDIKKPAEYKLPPEEKDVATQAYRALPDLAMYDDFGPIDPETLQLHLDLMRTYPASDKLPENWGFPLPEDIWTPEEEAAIKKAFKEQEAQKLSPNLYKSLMEGEPVPVVRSFTGDNAVVNYDDPSHHDRAIGRDNWKGLDKEGRGYPQGLSFSPLLSTNSLERELRDVSDKELLMYMDDGLIFGKTAEAVKNTIAKLQSALTKLGITLAPEKSGWIRENWSFVKSSKFLAIRINEDGTLVSETRSGTTRAFPNPLEYGDYLEFCANLEIEASTARIIYKDIYEPKGKEHIIWLGNVMGNILNYMYSPEASHDAQEIKIMKGRMAAIEKILRTRHKTLDKLEKYFPESITRPGLGERLEAVRLTSVSSIAAIRLLRYLRGRKNRRVRA